jgi:DNA (cytosine-5)-methyltransferase 1
VFGTAVPKTPIDEDGYPLLREDNVWPGWTVSGQADRKVNSKPQAARMQGRPDNPFWGSIAAPVCTHDAAPGVRNLTRGCGLTEFDAGPSGNLDGGLPTLVHDTEVTDAAPRSQLVDAEVDRAFLRRKTVPSPTVGGPSVHVVDLFSGCGGLTYGALEGFRRSGRPAELALAVDLEADPIGVMAETLGGDENRYTIADLAAITSSSKQDRSDEERKLFGGVPDGDRMILAGPPCQGHSALNNRTRHDDPRNDLYMAVASAARILKPKAIVAENVGSIGSDKRNAVSRCATALENLGYKVRTQRLNLKTIGVPQTRVRHVLVCTRERAFDFDLLPTALRRDVCWAIEDLLDEEDEGEFNRASRPSEENQRRIDWLFENNRYDLPNPRRPECHQSDHSYVSMYGRLEWEMPAQTITTGFGSMGQGRFVHPLRRRTLTPHEAARLQCLPDYVKFDGVTKRGSLATMIGNAAPPLLSMRVVSALIDQGLV